MEYVAQFGHEADPEPILHSLLDEGDEVADVVGAATVVGLDEVGVLGRHAGGAVPEPSEPGGVDERPRW